MASCFVGFTDRGEDVLDFPINLKRSLRRLPWTAVSSFPFLVLEVWHPVGDNPYFGLTYMFFRLIRSVLAIRGCLLKDYYLEKLSSIVSVFVTSLICIGIGEMFLCSVWMMLPYINCGLSLPKTKYDVSQCADDRCEFIYPSILTRECLNETWLKFVPDIFLEFPVYSDFKNHYWYKTPDSYYSHMSFFYIWTTSRLLCIDGVFATNTLETVCSLIMLLGGFFIHNWILPGEVGSFMIQHEMRKMELEEDLSILETYCEIEKFDETKKEKFMKHYISRFLYQKAFLTDSEFQQLPYRHQSNILSNSYAPFIKSTRIFRDIDNTVITSICYKIKIELYLKGENVILPGTVPPGLFLILDGTMLAIALYPLKSAAMVRLKKGDFFGEMSICFRLATPLLIVAESNCRVLVIHRKDFESICQYFPQKTRKAIILNHRGILESTVCIFHEGREVITPPDLQAAVKVFLRNNVREFPLDVCKQSKSNKETCQVTSKFANVWIWFIMVVAMCCYPVVFLEKYVADKLELVWPENVFSASKKEFEV